MYTLLSQLMYQFSQIASIQKNIKLIKIKEFLTFDKSDRYFITTVCYLGSVPLNQSQQTFAYFLITAGITTGDTEREKATWTRWTTPTSASLKSHLATKRLRITDEKSHPEQPQHPHRTIAREINKKDSDQRICHIQKR